MKVGIIQQHNGADHADNVHRLQERIRQLAHEGAELIVCLLYTSDAADD